MLASLANPNPFSFSLQQLSVTSSYFILQLPRLPTFKQLYFVLGHSYSPVLS